MINIVLYSVLAESFVLMLYFLYIFKGRDKCSSAAEYKKEKQKIIILFIGLSIVVFLVVRQIMVFKKQTIVEVFNNKGSLMCFGDHGALTFFLDKNNSFLIKNKNYIVLKDNSKMLNIFNCRPIKK